MKAYHLYLYKTNFCVCHFVFEEQRVASTIGSILESNRIIQLELERLKILERVF